MNKKLLFVCLAASFLAACGGSDDLIELPITGAQCTQLNKNTELFSEMKKNYLWNNDLPKSVKLDDYKSLSELLNAIKSPRDRFSFTMTEQEYIDRYVNAVFFGFGFSSEARFTDGVLKIRYVYDQSPAAEVGLKRADEIIEVNGVDMATWLTRMQQGTATNEDIFGPNEKGVTVDIVWRTPDNSVHAAVIEKTLVETNTVFHVQKEQIGNQKVGYFVFDSFIERSEHDINKTLDQLDGIDELIIDLRYNGGGLIRIANQLASQTAWHEVEHETFLTYNYNSNYRPNSILFDLGGGLKRLNLDRVYVLTTQASCSASELVINSLTPFIEVVTIGEPTCGKPVGQSPTKICDEILFAINFQTVNADGFGDYFDGLPVTCPATDTIVADWGSSRDPLLATAYYHVREGSCPLPSRRAGEFSLQPKAITPLTRNPLLDKYASEH